ncbi:Panacea domain-containing protein [Campylobacter fetus]|uniref:Panacea domain-containing protein n=1 Tax=Campylobacter fetus TaxID=196 RepID=UPI00073A727A|nr:Panacea domain-containing protein [Campylobacter fetus]ALV65025.1 hypothetical protein (DUF4065 domain) [Campylobacter fetus subsp. testudinum Sp3]
MNYKAAIQAVDYIIQNTSDYDILDKLSILKLLFFAERYSLRKFAQSITDDNFCAMRCGPVASKTYDLISFKDTLKNIEKEYSKEILSKDGSYGVKSNKLLITRNDYDELSDSDIESLDFSIKNYGKFSSKELINITHNFKEWNRFKNELEQNDTSIKIDINDFFEKTTKGTKEYSVISNEHVEQSKELFTCGDFK